MKNFKFNIRGSQYNVDIKNIEGNDIEIEVNGTSYLVEIEKAIKVSKTPTIVRKKLAEPDAKPMTGAGSLKSIKAPLPGSIFKLMVKEGDAVKKGDLLVILEAMKMENNILSEHDGIVKVVKVKEGDTILQNDLLIEIQ